MSEKVVGSHTVTGNHERFWNLGISLGPEDADIAARFTGFDPNGSGAIRDPDLVIAPDGRPYIYRWHLVPRNKLANAYFHIQVLDDPDRPLHDHPYDNTSVILAGGYKELIDTTPRPRAVIPHSRLLLPGDVVHREAEEAHRLFLLPDGPGYSMSLFSTGPRRRDWGFWCPTEERTEGGRVIHEWVHEDELVHLDAQGQSVFKGEDQ